VSNCKVLTVKEWHLKVQEAFEPIHASRQSHRVRIEWAVEGKISAFSKPHLPIQIMQPFHN